MVIIGPMFSTMRISSYSSP